MIISDPCWLCISVVHSLLVLISSSLYGYVTIYLYICWWTLGSFLILGYYKLSFTIKYLCPKWLDQMMGMLVFLEKLLKFCKAVEHFTFPSAMYESSNFSTSSATFGMGQSSDFYIDMYDIFSFYALSLNSALWIAEGVNFDEAHFIHHIFSIVCLNNLYLTQGHKSFFLGSFRCVMLLLLLSSP